MRNSRVRTAIGWGRLAETCSDAVQMIGLTQATISIHGRLGYDPCPFRPGDILKVRCTCSRWLFFVWARSADFFSVGMSPSMGRSERAQHAEERKFKTRPRGGVDRQFADKRQAFHDYAFPDRQVEGGRQSRRGCLRGESELLRC